MTTPECPPTETTSGYQSHEVTREEHHVVQVNGPSDEVPQMLRFVADLLELADDPTLLVIQNTCAGGPLDATLQVVYTTDIARTAE